MGSSTYPRCSKFFGEGGKAFSDSKKSRKPNNKENLPRASGEGKTRWVLQGKAARKGGTPQNAKEGELRNLKRIGREESRLLKV